VLAIIRFVWKVWYGIHIKPVLTLATLFVASPVLGMLPMTLCSTAGRASNRFVNLP
jgi:hypothetical protein